MIDILMMREGLFLKPVDGPGYAAIEEMTRGEELRVKITRFRNPKFHRLFFALINLVYQNQDEFATMEQMLDAIKRAIGYVEERKDLDGQLYYVSKSISFAKMDETSFKQFYNKVLNLILEKILPHIPKKDLEQQIFDLIREPGPDQLRA